MERYYKIANMIVAINGKNEVAMTLKEDFSTFAIENETRVDLYIDIIDDEKNFNIENIYSSLSGKILFNENMFLIKENDFVYSVTDLFNEKKQTVVKICFKKKSMKCLINLQIQPNLMGINTYSKYMVEKITNYNVMWYIFALTLMKKNAVFIHGGMLEYKGKGIVFSGTSGCGKTSTMAELLNDDGKYIAEDFGVLDSYGKLYRIPKKAALYQSDLKYGNQNYINAVKELGLVENLKWNFFSLMGKNPRGRFHGEDIFGQERVINCANADTLIFLERYSGSKVEFVDIPTEIYAKKVMYAAFREIKIIYELILNIRAIGKEEIWGVYPDLEIIQNRYLNILKKGILDKQVYEVKVPIQCAPQEITRELLKICN